MLASIYYPGGVTKNTSGAKSPLVQLNVRVPPRTIEELRKMAERDHRSVTQEIIYLVEQAAAQRS